MKIYLSIALSLCTILAVAQEIKVDTTRAKDLKDVVITGQFSPQTLKNSVYNVRTISAEKISLRAATSVQQVLSTELGFRFSNDLMLSTSDIQLMGMTGRNVKILLDGVPMVDRSDTRESLNQIDINTVERIEIVEGPMSVVYGTDALAGVINIITKNAGKSLLNISARVQEETVGNEYEAISGKGSHIQNLSASWQNRGWSVLAGFTHNDFGGWNIGSSTTPREEVDAEIAAGNRWKPKEQWLGNTKIGYRNAKFNIWYRLDGLEETIDSRGGMNTLNYKAVFQTYKTNRSTNQLQSEWNLNDRLQLIAIAGYTNLKRATKTVNHDFTTNIETLSTELGTQDVAKFNASIFRATVLYKLNNMVSFQPGFEFNRDAASGARISGSPSINDYALFISSEIKPAKGINIRTGLRFIKNSVYDAPPIIPSLNTKFSLNDDLDFRMAYARGFRSPALRELYYDFVDASHNIFGNPNLKAEESNSFNGSLAWAGIHSQELQFRSTLAGFYNQFKNRITFAQSATDASVTTLINVLNYKTLGGTLDNTFIYKNLNANVGISYIGRYNDLLETDATLDIPEFSWAPELTANLSYSFPKINGNISLFYKYTGNLPNYQSTTLSGVQTLKLTEIGSFHLADLMLNKNIYKYITLNAGIKNLLNVTKLTNTSTASGGAHSTGGSAVPFSYGRSYVFGLIFNWNKN
ncbi:TonB-dependent receptor plug domain-containing protein [Pedobacter fastidiosus]|uniref:TonB-dependent receptor n=1 Tax=Pedobacter fastidiosus TaxID=2765361 RepID=A0ABR7KML0_9SPHI|nr:TonB-dependent receptor [Pedobacter fastidiosus]MBC6109320.1 TonB-dependent receptor [Pedobacter fastidiosus]